MNCPRHWPAVDSITSTPQLRAKKTVATGHRKQKPPSQPSDVKAFFLLSQPPDTKDFSWRIQRPQAQKQLNHWKIPRPSFSADTITAFTNQKDQPEMSPCAGLLKKIGGSDAGFQKSLQQPCQRVSLAQVELDFQINTYRISRKQNSSLSIVRLTFELQTNSITLSALTSLKKRKVYRKSAACQTTTQATSVKNVRCHYETGKCSQPRIHTQTTTQSLTKHYNVLHLNL